MSAKTAETRTEKTSKTVDPPWPDDPDALDEPTKPAKADPVRTVPDLVTSDTFKALGKAAVELERQAKAERRTEDGTAVLNIDLLEEYAKAREDSPPNNKGKETVRGKVAEHAKELLRRTGPLVLNGTQYLLDGQKGEEEIIVRDKNEIDRIRREQLRPIEDTDALGKRRARA